MLLHLVIFVLKVFHVASVFSKDLSIQNNSLTKAMLLLQVNKASGNVYICMLTLPVNLAYIELGCNILSLDKWEQTVYPPSLNGLKNPADQRRFAFVHH